MYLILLYSWVVVQSANGVFRPHADATQQNVSKHLGLLHQAGIVTRRKEGTSVRYAIADASVFALCEQVCGGLRQQADELWQILSAGPA